MHAQSRCMSQYLRQSKSITCSGMCSETDGLGDQPSQQYRQGPITERGSCRHAHHISLLLPVCPTFLVSRQTSLCTASKSRSSPSTTRRARCMSLLTHPFHLHTTSFLFKRFSLAAHSSPGCYVCLPPSDGPFDTEALSEEALEGALGLSTTSRKHRIRSRWGCRRLTLLRGGAGKALGGGESIWPRACVPVDVEKRAA